MFISSGLVNQINNQKQKQIIAKQAETFERSYLITYIFPNTPRSLLVERYSALFRGKKYPHITYLIHILQTNQFIFKTTAQLKPILCI